MAGSGRGRREWGVTANRRAWLIALAQTLWLPAVFVAFWQVASSREWVNPFFFPPPSKVLATAVRMATEGELVSILAATLLRWAGGALAGIVLGLCCGVLMGVSRAARRALEPIVAGLYSTPKLTLLPLLMLLLGLGDAPKVILIALVGLIFLSTQTLDAIRGVKQRYVEMAVNHGAGRLVLVRRIYLPAAMPQIFTGLRIALSRSLVVAISLELISSTNGLGALIWMSWETLATERLYVGIVLAASIGIAMHRGLAALESVVVPWKGRQA
jgi:NitT/TauT family transport system permease protein